MRRQGNEIFISLADIYVQSSLQIKYTLPLPLELSLSSFEFNFEELYFACIIIYIKSQVSENSTDQIEYSASLCH